MTIEELTTIVQEADKSRIIEALKWRGYIDCKKHKDYKKITLVDLFNGDLLATEEYLDAKNKRRYQGGIITKVQGYENLEFILININDDKNQLPIAMLIWSKEV